jgi:hypothetical protein
MKKYRVIRQNFFMGILWNEGQFVEFQENIQPPHHFEEIKPPKVEKPTEEAPKKAAPKKKAAAKKTAEE